jgi:hypothetical protein
MLAEFGTYRCFCDFWHFLQVLTFSHRVFDERKSKDAAYPSIVPSVGDSPEYERSRTKRKDSKSGSPVGEEPTEWESASIEFAPPGPCYEGLRNNVSTHEMEMQCVSTRPSMSYAISNAYWSSYNSKHGSLALRNL